MSDIKKNSLCVGGVAKVTKSGNFYGSIFKITKETPYPDGSKVFEGKDINEDINIWHSDDLAPLEFKTLRHKTRITILYVIETETLYGKIIAWRTIDPKTRETISLKVETVHGRGFFENDLIYQKIKEYILSEPT